VTLDQNALSELVDLLSNERLNTRRRRQIRLWTLYCKSNLTLFNACTGWPKKVSHHQFFKKSY